MNETDLQLGGGRRLHIYDSGAHDGLPAVFWHHGTPQVGRPPDPLTADGVGPGVRWVAWDRPGYGRSSADPGHDVAAVASDATVVADTLGIERFAVLGASGGTPYALACAALLPERVSAAACLASLAPFHAVEGDWYADMAASNQTSFRIATSGRAAITAHLRDHPDLVDPEILAPADLDTLAGPYGTWLAETGVEALAHGLAGHVDDALAFVAPWGFDPAVIELPLLLVHGGCDRFIPPSHTDWLAHRCPGSQRWMFPNDSHLSIFEHATAAIEWISQQQQRAR